MVALAVTSQHFEQNRALAMGIIAAGSAAGGACFPVMLAKLVPAIGFRWTMRVIPLLFLFAYGIAILISRPKNPPRKMKSVREMVDFGGFRDVRYLVLAIATVIGNLGLYVPINYMGMRKPRLPTLRSSTKADHVQNYTSNNTFLVLPLGATP
jgi:MFS family permease